MIGVELQRVLEIGLGPIPLLVPLQRDAAPVEEAPVRFGEGGIALQGAIIGSDRVGESLAQAVEVAERQQRIAAVRPDRKSVVEGKSGSVRVDIGGRRII